MAGAGHCQAVPAEESATAVVAAKLGEELQVLERGMGLTQAPMAEPLLRRSGIREQYALASLVANKTAQLSRTHGLNPGRRLIDAQADATAGEVNVILKSALQRVLEVKSHRGIVEAAKESEESELGDAYEEIVRCSRLLDRLLAKKVDHADLYLRMNQSIGMAMRICLTTSGQRVPSEAAQKVEPTVAELFSVLSECYQLEMEGAAALGVVLPRWTGEPRHAPTLGEVEELTVLVLSEMEFLYGKLKIESPPFKAVFKEERDLLKLVKRSTMLRGCLRHIAAQLEETEEGE